MVTWLTPARRRGVEVLDDPATSDDVRRRAMDDVARSNRLFGGARAAVRAVNRVAAADRPILILDLGTGAGDIPARIRRRYPNARVVGLDVSTAQLRTARARMDAVVAGSALTLPLRDGAVDIVLCSQLLHHFREGDARTLLREAHRVSRGWVVISDIRRSWLAAVAFWTASMALRFHPVTRHDGVVSVLRGFTELELRALIREAVGADAVIERGVFWRLGAAWAKGAAHSFAAYT
jgi:2-polyprenyl-3-methyl-5-hydroxy-6-metoxy-1,4-benzoquinol methylase